MIELMSDLPDHVVGLTAIGTVTGKDYEDVIVPVIEEKLKTHPKLRLVYHLGNDFKSFTAAAMWDDTKVGVKHLTAWEKIAMVTDVDWIKTTAKVFGFVMPAQVKIFDNDELDAARAWVSS